MNVQSPTIDQQLIEIAANSAKTKQEIATAVAGKVRQSEKISSNAILELLQSNVPSSDSPSLDIRA